MIQFECNGQAVEVSSSPETSLLDILRTNLGLQGTKKGCDEGDCGACSVIIDDKLANACLIPIGKLNGAKVMTIEGLAQNGLLHPIQQAFLESGAVQCGYCTPGMIIATYVLLMHNPNPTEANIKEALAGNLCRCTGYTKIVAAVQKAVNYLADCPMKPAIGGNSK